MPTKQPRDPSQKALECSAAWISGADSITMMKVFDTTSTANALKAVTRYRNVYGTELFPYRKEALAHGGYSNKKIRVFSKLWLQKRPAEEIASKTGLNSAASVWGTIHYLRGKYGTMLFPLANARKDLSTTCVTKTKVKNAIQSKTSTKQRRKK